MSRWEAHTWNNQVPRVVGNGTSRTMPSSNPGFTRRSARRLVNEARVMSIHALERHHGGGVASNHGRRESPLRATSAASPGVVNVGAPIYVSAQITPACHTSRLLRNQCPPR